MLDAHEIDWSGETPVTDDWRKEILPASSNGSKAARSRSATGIAGLDPTFLADAVDVIREGQELAQAGVRYTVDGIIPNYGMLGMLVAFAKVGKTTLGQAMAADVAMGRPFLDHETTRCRVLEDPPNTPPTSRGRFM